MNADLLLWPIAIHALATLSIYLPMWRVRMRTVMEGKVRAGVYRLGDGEPEESRKFSNAIRNQNETGLPFYAACLVAHAAGGAPVAVVVLAWAFLVLKLVHLAIHVTTNRLRHRRPAFQTALIALAALWLAVALDLAGVL
ncbi:MAG: hypothetical protein BroJett030_30670 [Alphaproteobacteria bacterium]|nr:MAG: hypothetical protein BroJett030_30670 [Alphaproteobacteria bacterium]